MKARDTDRDGAPALEVADDLLERMVAEAPRSPRIDGIVVARVRGTDEGGAPLVDLAEAGISGVRARSLVEVRPEDAGREAAVVFESGDTRRPLLLGLIAKLGARRESAAADPPKVEIDGERVTLTGAQEVVLRCGRASITLTRAGKVLIRGDYVLSRSSGVNRIKGGSVQLN